MSKAPLISFGAGPSASPQDGRGSAAADRPRKEVGTQSVTSNPVIASPAAVGRGDLTHRVDEIHRLLRRPPSADSSQ